jgi:hypothetical protein
MATALKRIADPHRHLATKQRWRPIEVACWLATPLPSAARSSYRGRSDSWLSA